MFRIPKRPILVLVVLVTFGATLLIAAGRLSIHQVKQTPPVQMGTSGGNVKDISAGYCCSGTLGSLVQSGNNYYILSNNHVLGRSGQASPGEDISQPGMVDTGCSTANSNIVAGFTSGKLGSGSNVDAALAQVKPNMVDQTGAILEVGVPSATPAAPALNMTVAKSGRTTGFTCGPIGSINTSVTVQYETGCNGGSTWNVSYTNQVVVSSSKFSAGGDSGSLILTAATAQPVALLFAGSSTATIGNPIGDVQRALNVSFVGGGNHALACGTGGSHGKPKSVSAKGLMRAAEAKEKHASKLMEDLAVLGVGVGVDDVDESEAVVVIYVEEGRAHGYIPTDLDGVKTKIVRTDKFRAYGWNEPRGSACGKQ